MKKVSLYLAIPLWQAFRVACIQRNTTASKEIAKLLEQITGAGLQILKLGGLRRQNVMCAANRLIFSRHGRKLYDTYVY